MNLEMASFLQACRFTSLRWAKRGAPGILFERASPNIGLFGGTQ